MMQRLLLPKLWVLLVIWPQSKHALLVGWLWFKKKKIDCSFDIWSYFVVLVDTCGTAWQLRNAMFMLSGSYFLS